MDRDDIIRRIIEADRQARSVPEKAQRELDGIEEELVARREEMRKEYYDHAERRIENVRKTEEEYADAQVAKIEADTKREVARIEREAEGMREAWADKLFRATVAEPEGE